LARNSLHECGSDVVILWMNCGVAFPRHTCAQPMK